MPPPGSLKNATHKHHKGEKQCEQLQINLVFNMLKIIKLYFFNIMLDEFEVQLKKVKKITAVCVFNKVYIKQNSYYKGSKGKNEKNIVRYS